MQERNERHIEIYGESLQEKADARAIEDILRRRGLITKEVVEKVIYIGLPELKAFEAQLPEPGRLLAEGSLRAILKDEKPFSPVTHIRRLSDESIEGMTGEMIALNDLRRIAEEGRLQQIQGIGPRRRQFLEEFTAAAYDSAYFADLRDPMPGPKLD